MHSHCLLSVTAIFMLLTTVCYKHLSNVMSSNTLDGTGAHTNIMSQLTLCRYIQVYRIIHSHSTTSTIFQLS